MFEQELYNQPIDVRAQPGDLFYHYEIKNWDFSPKLYKILAGSAIFNIIALLAIGSSGMLTKRGCESPFVGRVCQVLDTVYVGSLLFGTESEYADVDFDPTKLGEAEVTFVDVTGVTPPLTYPAGYFQLANPEQQFSNVTDPMAGFGDSNMIAPGIPMTTPGIGGSGLLNTPQILPPNNPEVIDVTPPNDSLSGSGTENPTIPRKGKRGNRPFGGTTADANTNSNKNPAVDNSNTPNSNVAANVDEAKEDEWGVFINKRPMRLEAKESLEQIDAGKVKIDTPFKVVISGTLGLAKDGKTVVLQNPKPVPSNPPIKNDPVMEKFVQDWILAVGDAGWFGHLTRVVTPTPKNVVITVEQNDTNFIASLRTDQPSEAHAKQQSSSFNLFMDIARRAASGDNRTFLEAATVNPDGKNLVLSFTIPKPVVNDLIMRKLAESKEKEAKPEGNALPKSSDNNAER